MTKMAANAAKSLIDFMASGFSVVSDEEQARRMAICESCEHFDKGQRRCKICGCFARLKARIEREHCPAGKW